MRTVTVEVEITEDGARLAEAELAGLLTALSPRAYVIVTVVKRALTAALDAVPKPHRPEPPSVRDRRKGV